jgi:hypothetical protein
MEGLVTVLCAVPTLLFTVDFPDRAKFLTEQERMLRMQQLKDDKGDIETEQISWKNLKDLKGA